MYMRAVTIRIVYLGIASAAILLSVALRETTVEVAPSVPVKYQVSAAAQPPVVTLPTVYVTARADRDAAPAMPAARQRAIAQQQHAEGIEQADADARVNASLPTLRLDMPYYSFGRVLPRVAQGINR